MAWNSPVTWVDDTTPGAADLNAQVRDNLLYLYERTGRGARVYNNANITLSNGAVTALTFNSERFDTDSFHSTSVNPSRLTIPVTGLYLCGLHEQFATNGTGVRAVAIRLNGTTNIGVVEQVPAAAASTDLSLTTLYSFTAGDYIEAIGYQNSGGSLDVVAVGNASPEFWIRGPL